MRPSLKSSFERRYVALNFGQKGQLREVRAIKNILTRLACSFRIITDEACCYGFELRGSAEQPGLFALGGSGDMQQRGGEINQAFRYRNECARLLDEVDTSAGGALA